MRGKAVGSAGATGVPGVIYLCSVGSVVGCSTDVWFTMTMIYFYVDRVKRRPRGRQLRPRTCDVTYLYQDDDRRPSHYLGRAKIRLLVLNMQYVSSSQLIRVH